MMMMTDAPIVGGRMLNISNIMMISFVNNALIRIRLALNVGDYSRKEQ
ncbi:hypothetical protein [Paenibacillus alba]|nr:hypothetical protein [Paenibacillus alba]